MAASALGDAQSVSQTQFDWEDDNDLAGLTHRFLGSEDVMFQYGHDKSGQLTAEGVSEASWLYAPVQERIDSYGMVNEVNQYADVNGVAIQYDANGNRISL